ncbi:DUF2798 domain-containing protein [Massilia sp. CCM 8734]|uniref:DUF2798 domain-containing protein n=1 Tax=Massilia sp. CCM 8734 TaxID=2609283 RepID=UPI001E3F72C9|nr:DUF2798 domain-containing protein [Massilia sp. CCM 8734]
MITLIGFWNFKANNMSNQFKTRLLFSVVMSALMSFLMTGWVTWLNLGFGPDYPARWMRAFLAAWPAAFTIVMLCGPTVQRFCQRFIDHKPA